MCAGKLDKLDTNFDEMCSLLKVIGTPEGVYREANWEQMKQGQKSIVEMSKNLHNKKCQSMSVKICHSSLIHFIL